VGYALQDLSNVKYVCLRGLPKLESLPTSKMRAVRHLEVHGGSAISSIDLRDLSGLTTLDLVGCSSLAHMPGLGQLAAMERLHLSSTHKLDLPDLSGMTSLKEFSLHDCCSSLTALSGLQRLKALVYFNINTHLSLQHLGIAEHLISLRTLLIIKCPALKAVPDLTSCTKLEHIKLSLCKQIRELPGLQEVACLQELVLEGLPALQQKQLDLAKMKYLELLSIRDCGGLSEMPDLSTMTRLHKFTSNGLAGSDLFPAEGLVRRLHTFCTQNDLVGGILSALPGSSLAKCAIEERANLCKVAMWQHAGHVFWNCCTLRGTSWHS
jgi:Leucine-rich repeat (LRR) protein